MITRANRQKVVGTARETSPKSTGKMTSFPGMALIAPGLLKAVGIENDKEMESDILQTYGEAAIIKISADIKDSDTYAGHTRKVWKGRAPVVI